MAAKNTEKSKTPSSRREEGGVLAPLVPCRIAVYDDLAATPQIIEIGPQPIESYMNAISQEVIGILRGFQSSIPFMVVRECVENLIHASFKNPTISILHKGLVVRFSDQGPGIAHKEGALEFGATTATSEMRKYIRGVGSGLPVANQYMQDKGGSLIIEDNLDRGCIVTVSLKKERKTAHNKTAHKAAYSRSASTPSEILREELLKQEKEEEPLPASSTSATPPNKMIHSKNYGEEVENPPLVLALEEKEKLALLLCLAREKIGPTDLMQLFGHSLSTWSRTLQYLVGLGLMNKPAHQQKYRLSQTGKEFAAHNI